MSNFGNQRPIEGRHEFVIELGYRVALDLEDIAGDSSPSDEFRQALRANSS
jgi:hypothetical protein